MTPRQYEIFTAIARFLEEEGYSPSQQRLAYILGMSQGNVGNHINQLIRRGLVQKDPHIYCSLHLTEAGKIKWQEIRK